MKDSKNLPVLLVGLLIALGVLAVVFYKYQKPSNTGLRYSAPSQNYQTGRATPTKGAQVNQTNANLALTVTSPLNGAIVKNSSISIQGKTVPKADVFVNDMETVADSKGNFSINLNLEEGENIISVSANDADGNYAEQELTVTYEPAQ